MNITHALSPCGTREDYEKDKPKKNQWKSRNDLNLFSLPAKKFQGHEIKPLRRPVVYQTYLF